MKSTGRVRPLKRRRTHEDFGTSDLDCLYCGTLVQAAGDARRAICGGCVAKGFGRFPDRSEA